MGGICALEVKPDPYAPPASKNIWVEIENGRVVSVSESEPQRSPDAWASGKTAIWLASVLDGHYHLVESSGNRELFDQLLKQIHTRTYIGGLARMR